MQCTNIFLLYSCTQSGLPQTESTRVFFFLNLQETLADRNCFRPVKQMHEMHQFKWECFIFHIMIVSVQHRAQWCCLSSCSLPKEKIKLTLGILLIFSFSSSSFSVWCPFIAEQNASWACPLCACGWSDGLPGCASAESSSLCRMDGRRVNILDVRTDHSQRFSKEWETEMITLQATYSLA